MLRDVYNSIMKVLLINENRTKENIIPYPLGISYVSRAAREAGHDVLGLDLLFSKNITEELKETVEEFSPDCIGLSIRNIDNQDIRNSIFYVEDVKEIVECLRSVTRARIILGGAGFSIFPSETLEYLGVELGIAGEGEQSFPELLECLSKGGNPEKVNGVFVLTHISRRQTIPAPFKRFPDFRGADLHVFKVEPYIESEGHQTPFSVNIQSRRGCPLGCIYCPNPLIEGRNLRFRRAETVVEELATLEAEHGVNSVFFTDSLFNYPYEYTEELCREILRRGVSIEWRCSIAPFEAKPGLFELMRKAGCTHVSIGNESGSEITLQALGKNFGKKEISKCVNSAKEAGINVNCFLLLGGPGETRETVLESIEFMDELSPDAVSVTVGIRIYPGCKLADIAKSEGIISPKENLLKPKFYLSREVEPWLYEYMRNVVKDRKGWML